MRTICCNLGLYPPPSSNKLASNASLIPTKPPQVSLVKNEGCCWRRQYCVVIGVASCCTIIGLELCNSVTTFKHDVVSKEEIVFVTTDEDVSSYNSSLSVSVGGSAKWSEKRACLPWRGSSLETIVPENLPRPAARRRYETVRSTSKIAPPLSGSVKHKTNGYSCFSM